LSTGCRRAGASSSGRRSQRDMPDFRTKTFWRARLFAGHDNDGGTQDRSAGFTLIR
jgi:hypothetical protein